MACLCFLFCAFFGIKDLFFSFKQTDLPKGFDCIWNLSCNMVCSGVNNWTLHTAILVYGGDSVLGKKSLVSLVYLYFSIFDLMVSSIASTAG